MIEEVLRNFLNDMLPVPVFMEYPKNPPYQFVVIEKEGSQKTDNLSSGLFAFQSYGKTLYDVATLNEKVKKAMEKSKWLDEIARVQLNSDYNYTDTGSKEYRYQAVYDINYYDDQQAIDTSHQEALNEAEAKIKALEQQLAGQESSADEEILMYDGEIGDVVKTGENLYVLEVLNYLPYVNYINRIVVNDRSYDVVVGSGDFNSKSLVFFSDPISEEELSGDTVKVYRKNKKNVIGVVTTETNNADDFGMWSNSFGTKDYNDMLFVPFDEDINYILSMAENGMSRRFDVKENKMLLINKPGVSIGSTYDQPTEITQYEEPTNVLDKTEHRHLIAIDDIDAFIEMDPVLIMFCS